MADGHELINFGGNDYLGLAADPRLVRAAQEAMQDEAWGSGASPLVTGYGRMHARLEQRLAEFEASEAALVFSSGYVANLGAITSLVGRGDVIFSDAKNHASIIDGCRLSGARIQVYPHCDVDFLENMLAQADGFRKRLIVSDSLFSMDGDLAPLEDLADAAGRYDAMLMIDEAHATGVFGPEGRGVAEHLGIEDRVPIRVATLSKALGSSGGVVAGRRSLIDLLVNRARPYIFSTAHPAACSAAALAALDVVRDEPQRRGELLGRAEQLRRVLRAQGWDVGNSQSQIIPVFLGDPGRTMEYSAALRKRGLLVPGIRPPSVPEGESLLRISLTYAHTPEMIQALIDGCDSIRMEK